MTIARLTARLTAFGGGTLRDILLDRRPLFWVQHAGWPWVLLALCIAAMMFMRAAWPSPGLRQRDFHNAGRVADGASAGRRFSHCCIQGMNCSAGMGRAMK